MDPIALIIFLIVVGVLLWLMDNYIPMDQVKKSKFGRQAVIKDGSGEYKTIAESELAAGEYNYLEDVFVNGKLVREQTFDQVRELAKL